MAKDEPENLVPLAIKNSNRYNLVPETVDKSLEAMKARQTKVDPIDALMEQPQFQDQPASLHESPADHKKTGPRMGQYASVEKSVQRIINYDKNMPLAYERFIRELQNNPDFTNQFRFQTLDVREDGALDRSDYEAIAQRILQRNFEKVPVQTIANELGSDSELQATRAMLSQNDSAEMQQLVNRVTRGDGLYVIPESDPSRTR